MEIKKTPKGFEVDGITFDTRDVAERYVKSIQTQEKADTAWLDERIDYKFDPNEKSSSFKLFIEKIARAHSLNITQIAERIGVKRQTLYNWMDGKVMPDKGNLDKIRRIFNVSQEEITLATLDNFTKAYPEYIQVIQTSSPSKPSITDPATGSGNFLAAAITLVARKLGFGSAASRNKSIVVQSDDIKITVYQSNDFDITISILSDDGKPIEAKSLDELQTVLTALRK
jgi:transcriptional regulator with XRE-family HTH domain